MITIYHNLDHAMRLRLADPAFSEPYQPDTGDLELAGFVADTDDLTAAFDRVIHRDGENWTDDEITTFFGDPRERRSTQEGDVFVTRDGAADLVLSLGFRALPDLRLPYLP